MLEFPAQCAGSQSLMNFLCRMQASSWFMLLSNGPYKTCMFAGLCESCAFLVRFVDLLGFLSFYTKDGFNLQETATQIHRNVEKNVEKLYTVTVQLKMRDGRKDSECQDKYLLSGKRPGTDKNHPN